MIRVHRWTVILLFFATSAFGIDLEVSSRLDNLYWASGRTNSVSGRTFQGSDLFWNLQGSVTQELTDSLVFKGGIEIDPVLRWRAYSRLAFDLENLTLEFSPLIGVFNTTQKWFNPGLEAGVQYTWPGAFFVRAGFLTTFAPVAKSGDYYLSSQSFSVGALMENGIVSFHVEDKAATIRTLDTLTTVDATTKYWLDTEMFLKNFPLRWALITGYQATGRSYIASTETTTTLHSALLGARFSWDFGAGTVVWAQAESALFNVGWNAAVLAVPSTTGLFQATVGARYHW
jgi:hypothetical protein